MLGHRVHPVQGVLRRERHCVRATLTRGPQQVRVAAGRARDRVTRTNGKERRRCRTTPWVGPVRLVRPRPERRVWSDNSLQPRLAALSVSPRTDTIIYCRTPTVAVNHTVTLTACLGISDMWETFAQPLRTRHIL